MSFSRCFAFSIVLVSLFGAAQQPHAVPFEPWQGILEPSRGMDWSHAGCCWDPFNQVMNPIPANRPLCGALISPTATDITDATTINQRIQDCGNSNSQNIANGTDGAIVNGVTCPRAGCTVALDQGTFTIVQGITFGGQANYNVNWRTVTNNITLKGAGPDKTKLVVVTPATQDCGGSGNAICISATRQTPNSSQYGYQGQCAWTGGYTKGSTVLTLENCVQTLSGTSVTPDGTWVGRRYTLDQRNDDLGLLGCTSSGTMATCQIAGLTISQLPPQWKVGACVGIGTVGNTLLSGTSIPNWVPGTMTGYNVQAYTPNRWELPQTCTAITAINPGPPVSFTYPLSPNPNDAAPGCTGSACPCTFCGNLSNSNLPSTFGTPSGCPTPTPSNLAYSCLATVDPADQGDGVNHGGIYITGIMGVTTFGNAAGGRVCPDTIANSPTCFPGERSWKNQIQMVTIIAVCTGAGTGIATPGGSVTAVPACQNSNQVVIDTPLYANNWRPEQEPGIFWFNAEHTGLGIEGLSVDSSNDGGGQNQASITIQSCFNCWIRNVRSISGSRAHIFIQTAAHHVTVRDSYFFGTKRAASQSYGVDAFISISDLLIENNICVHVVSCMMVEGSYGSVWSYSYSYDEGYNTASTLMAGVQSNHLPTGQSLYEGNSASVSTSDNTHGSQGGPQTYFRNRFRGNNMPPKMDALRATQFAALNRANSVIGSVLGTIGTQGYYQQRGRSNIADTSTLVGCPGRCLFFTGKNGQGDGAYGARPGIPDDPAVWNTLMRWGNWVSVAPAYTFSNQDPTGASNTILFCGAAPLPANCNGVSEVPTTSYMFLPATTMPQGQTLPNSFYLHSMPSWWTTPWGTPHWPPIGPDVTGGNNQPNNCPTQPSICGDDLSGHSYLTPAQIAALHMPIDPTYVLPNSINSGSNAMVWSSNAAQSYPGFTIQGSFRSSVFQVFQLSGSNPPEYDGLYQIASSNAITPGGAPAVTGLAGGNVPNINDSASPMGNLGAIMYTVTRVDAANNETAIAQITNTPTSGGAVPSASCLATGTNTGNCSARVDVVAATGAVGVNFYMRYNFERTGKFCKQNPTPVLYTDSQPAGCPAGNACWLQTTPLITADANSYQGQACVSPPTESQVIGTTITALRPTAPVAPLVQAGTVTGQMVQVFNADNLYGTSALPPQPPTISGFTANPSSIAPGGSATLNWTVTPDPSTPTTTVTLSGVGTVGLTGPQTVSPTSTTTYTLTTTNANGSVSQSVIVTVTVPPPPPGINGVGTVQGQGVIKQ